MKLGSMDPALVCSGPMSTFSYDSHPVSRGRYGVFRQDEDELPRVYKNEVSQEPGEAGYCLQDMDLEIQRVARELYKAFNGLNEGFKEAKDQVVIDELSSHTDKTRQELIHPYKTIYGRNLNSVLKDNLGPCWEDACASLMCEMRMYELECLRRRMEDTQAAEMMAEADLSLMSPLSPMSGSSKKSKSSGSGSGKKKAGTDSATSTAEQAEQFTGISCLLITWKSNPEVEHFKELYLSESRKMNKKDHKKKNKGDQNPTLCDIVTEQSLEKNYKILGKGKGTERLLVKGKKDQLDEVDGDPYEYYLLAGTSHPYPDDTFYSVGRVPRKLLMKYLGIKMYLVRLRQVPGAVEHQEWTQCRDQADLIMACTGIIN